VATAFKLALQHISPLQLLAGTSFFSLLVTSLYLYYKGLLSKAINSLHRAGAMVLALSMLNPVAYYLVLFNAYDLLPAQIAQSLNYLWAIVITLLSVPILKYKLKKKDVIAIVTAYIGVVFIFFGAGGGDGKLSWLGLFLVLLSTFIWALYWLLITKNKQDSIIILFQSFLIGFPILLLLMFYFDGFNPMPFKVWLYLAYIGTFEMGMAFIFWQLALQTTDNVSKISILVFLSPVISLFFIGSILGEAIYSTTFIGLALIIGGIILQKKQYK